MSCLLLFACEGTLGRGDSSEESGSSQAAASDDPAITDSEEVAQRCEPGALPRPTPSLLLPQKQLLATVEALLGPTPLTLADLPADTKTSNFIQAEVHRASADGVRQWSTAAQIAAAHATQEHLDALLPCPENEFDAACRESFVEGFLTSAFRRPATPEEQQRYGDFLSARASDLGETAAIELFIEAVLQSPAFLYRFEETTEDGGNDGAPLAAHSLAVRLSYFLTGAPPDDELTLAANEGRLQTSEQIEAQTRRILVDTHGEGMVEFFQELLHLDFAQITKGGDVIDGVAPMETLSEGWQLMFASLIEEVMSEGGSLTSLLTSSSLSVPAELASIYPTDSPRSGLLTQPGLLAALAHDHTSPVLRGVFVRDHLLCDPVPPPPAGVEANIPAGGTTNTTRERYAQLEDDPSCRSCHQLIHSIGFAFEEFDALGRHRSDENGYPIDPSGEFIGFSDPALQGTYSGVLELGSHMAESEQFIGCMTRRLYEAGASRALDQNDECALQTLTGETMMNPTDANLTDMIVAFVTSPRFTTRPVEVTP